MPKAPLSFRFSEDFVNLLRTWSFVTETDQRALLEQAFIEYTERHPETKAKVNQIIKTLE